MFPMKKPIRLLGMVFQVDRAHPFERDDRTAASLV
jgi:hypothetical protein